MWLKAAITVSLAAAFSLNAWADESPAFSWEHIPLFAHLGKTSGDFTTQEVQFLASHFSIVTIEKAQALAQRGSTEAGAKAAVAQLKAANPRVKVLVYWNAHVDYDKMYQSLQGGLPAPWFVGEGAFGEPQPRPWRDFDTSNAEFRKWWIETGAALVENSGADGIFVDAIVAIASRPKVLEARFGPERSAAMIAGAKMMLDGLKHRLGNDAIVIFNGLRSTPGGWPNGGVEFLPFASGAMVEEFAFGPNYTKERLAEDMQNIQAAEAAGKIILVKGWPASAPARPSDHVDPAQMTLEAPREMEFPLACFLIVASEHSYFSYSWGWRSDDGWFQWYEQFDRELGPPQGPATRTGWVYERAFEHAQVRVDLDARIAHIQWH